MPVGWTWPPLKQVPARALAVPARRGALCGHLPRPADWVTGPGSLRPDPTPWDTVRQAYGFVDELAALRPRITGAGNLDRFDYWLNTFRCLHATAAVRCVWARYNETLAKVMAEKDETARKNAARDLLLPVRAELVAAFAETQRWLLESVSNPGELGTICNWQQQSLPVILTGPGADLAKLLGGELPLTAQAVANLPVTPRIFVPEVRTGIVAGESLKLTVIVLGGKPSEAALYWRSLGTGDYVKVPLTHVARGVYAVELTAAAINNDFEYYVQASLGQQKLLFPATGATLPQTVVVCGK